MTSHRNSALNWSLWPLSGPDPMKTPAHGQGCAARACGRRALLVGSSPLHPQRISRNRCRLRAAREARDVIRIAEIVDSLPITKARAKYGAVTETRSDEV